MDSTYFSIPGFRDINYLIHLRRPYYELLSECNRTTSNFCHDEYFWKQYNQIHYDLTPNDYFPNYRGIDMAYLMESVKDLHFENYDSNRMADFIWKVLEKVFAVNSLVSVQHLISALSFSDVTFNDLFDDYESEGLNLHQAFAQALILELKNTFLPSFHQEIITIPLNIFEIEANLGFYFPNDVSWNDQNITCFLNDPNNILSVIIKDKYSDATPYLTPVGIRYYPYNNDTFKFYDLYGNALIHESRIFAKLISYLIGKESPTYSYPSMVYQNYQIRHLFP